MFKNLKYINGWLKRYHNITVSWTQSLSAPLRSCFNNNSSAQISDRVFLVYLLCPENKFKFLDTKPHGIAWHIWNCCYGIAITRISNYCVDFEWKFNFFTTFVHTKITKFEYSKTSFFHSSLIFMCRWNLWIVSFFF